MSEKIVMREFQNSDSKELEKIIRKTWNYDRFCEANTAEKLARVYLNTCLMNQTFNRVALIENVPVGIIMGKNIQKHKTPLKLFFRWLRSVISLYISSDGRAAMKMFGGIDSLDDEMLKACGKNYMGELSFFAVNEEYRGMGIGKKLFIAVRDYMESQSIEDFYLFTDTSCNYGFYEHMGLERRCKKEKVIDLKKEKDKLTFFVYDYRIRK